MSRILRVAQIAERMANSPPDDAGHLEVVTAAALVVSKGISELAEGDKPEIAKELEAVAHRFIALAMAQMELIDAEKN